MRDVLCIYYSRTGNTKRVMETIAKEMDAELLALTDGVEPVSYTHLTLPTN